ncbi:MAG: hypothetical protein FWH55_12710 [Oscillospiraceae bacterium]|nr:hypothetical protein [Oscillospiraceae bacterium]
MADKITFFPVGNGDMTMIEFQNRTTILIDCNIRMDDERPYDCLKYLKEHLPKEDGKPYVDAFILTHHHDDHCHEASELFWFGNPAYRPAGKVLVKELIVTPRLLIDEEIENEHAKAVRKEADRRLRLWGTDSFDKDGNRMQIIGYSSDLKGYDEMTTVAGNPIGTINGTSCNGYELFVLGPVKKDNDDEDANINDTSIVLKITFIKKKDTFKKRIVMIAGGDELCDNLVDIIDKNPDMMFDVLIAPHHCSWHSISNEDSKTGEAHDTIKQFLDASRDKAHVIASSKPIKRDNDNPPSYRAKNVYLKHLDNTDRFICLGEYPSEAENKPLILDVSFQGITVDGPGEISEKPAASSSLYAPKTYG